MTRSSPKVAGLNIVNLCSIQLLYRTLPALEYAYSQWYQPLSTGNAIKGLMLVIGWGIYLLILLTEWDNVVAQYWPRELLRDRALSWLEVCIPAVACGNAVWILWETGRWPWSEVLRVVFALFLVIGAIPGLVHMWVALFRLGRSQSQIS